MKFDIFPFIAFFLHQYATFCRIGLTHDSHYFLAAARSFTQHFTFLNPNGTYFTNWTPLFPFLLAPIPDSLLGFFQGLVLLFTLIIFQKTAFEEIKTPFFRFFFSISLCFSPYLMLESVFLWSEAVFVLLLVLHYHAAKFYEQKPNAIFFVFWIFMGFLLCLQRHAGIFFVTGTFAYYGLAQAKAYTTKNTIKYFLYLIFSLSGWFFWLLRNHFVSSEPLPSITSRLFEGIGHNVLVYSESLSLFFLPNFLPFEWRIGILLVCSVVIVSFSLRFAQAKTLNMLKTSVGRSPTMKSLLNFVVGLRPTKVIYSTFLIFVYLAAMLCLEKANFWEVERYVGVIYPFVFLNLAVFLEQDFSQKILFQRIMYVILLVWLAYPVFRTLKNVIFWQKEFCMPL